MRLRRKRLRRVKVDYRQCRLFFIKPRENTDAHSYAEKLALMSNVQEVMVTEGECGFIVKTRGDVLEEIPEKELLIAKSSYKKISSYYQYRSDRKK